MLMLFTDCSPEPLALKEAASVPKNPDGIRKTKKPEACASGLKLKLNSNSNDYGRTWGGVVVVSEQVTWGVLPTVKVV